MSVNSPSLFQVFAFDLDGVEEAGNEVYVVKDTEGNICKDSCHWCISEGGGSFWNGACIHHVGLAN